MSRRLLIGLLIVTAADLALRRSDSRIWGIQAHDETSIRLDDPIEPTRVSLQGTMTVAAALQELSQQSGVAMKGGEGERDQRSFDWMIEDLAFWPALDSVLQRSGWTYGNWETRPGPLMLTRQNPSAASPPCSYDGPFRISAVRVVAKHDQGPMHSDRLDVQIWVQWEPRLHPISITQATSTIHAFAGQQALPIQLGETRLPIVVVPNVAHVTYWLPFDRPPPDSETIQIKGSLEMLLPWSYFAFRFEDLKLDADPIPISHRQVEIQLEKWQKVDGAFVASVRMHLDDADALESFRSWPLDNEVVLDDDMGTQYRPVRIQLKRQADDEVALDYEFNQDPTGLTLVYRAPTEMRRLSIPYDLQNIRLPAETRGEHGP